MKKSIFVLSSILLVMLLGACGGNSGHGSESSQSSETTSTTVDPEFEKLINTAKADIKEGKFVEAVKSYNGALKIKNDKQVTADRTSVQLLIQAKELLVDKKYPETIDLLAKAKERTDAKNIVSPELNTVYQQALEGEKAAEKATESAAETQEKNEQQKKATEKSTLWNTTKTVELDSFMKTWGNSMGQQYERYTIEQPGDFYGLSLPERAVERAAYNEQKIPATLSENGEEPDSYNVVAVYSDSATAKYMNMHLYLFTIYNGQPIVLVTMQNQGNPENLLYFKETENTDLKNGFSGIVKG